MKTNKHTLGSLLIISFLLVVATFDVKAQSNWEVGLRFGEPTVALDATVPLSAAPRLHLAAHLEDPFVLGAYFDWMFSLSNGPTGLKFYPGVGPEFSFGSDFDFIIGGDFGAEYSFDFPLTIFFDWRPGFVTTDSFKFRSDNVGIGARFRFGEGVGFKEAD